MQTQAPEDLPLAVPAILVEPMRGTLLHLYQAVAESLHGALVAHLHVESQAPLDKVHQSRARLRQLDDALGQLGWDGREPSPDGVALSAPNELLREALDGAMIDVGERVATGCRNWRDNGSPKAVRQAVAQLHALDHLQQARQT